jgi:hypothetical protein
MENRPLNAGIQNDESYDDEIARNINEGIS